jgi:phosphate transport system permease protein
MSSSFDLSSETDKKLIAQAPGTADRIVDRVFRGATVLFSWLTIVLVVVIVLEIAGKAMPAIQQHGTSLLTSTTWDSNRGQYGILPEIWGTIYSSVLGLVIGSAFGIAIAIFLTQDFLPPKVELVAKNVIELLAAIPSVVYGLWGIFIVIPMMRPTANWLHEHLADVPLLGRLFSTPLGGPGMLPAAVVLAIMILPTVSAISRNALVSVPHKLKEAAVGLGATKWEAILGVIVPTASSGIFGSIVLAFGRALGETMALAMLIGNSNQLSVSLFSPGDTLAALLANRFPESTVDEKQILMYAALVLLGITLIVNCLGAAILNRASARLSGISK